MTEITVQINKEVYQQIKFEVAKVIADIEEGKRTGHMPITVGDQLCRLLQYFIKNIEAQLP